MSARAHGAALALALALGGAGPARADGAAGRARLALEPLRAVGVSEAFAHAVEERVCAALGDRPALEVVCPSDVAAAALLARNAALFGECQGDECLRRVDAVKAADQRVTGALEKVGRGIVLSLQLTPPEGARPRVVEQLPDDLDAVLARIPALVNRLLP